MPRICTAQYAKTSNTVRVRAKLSWHHNTYYVCTSLSYNITVVLVVL